jgi:hypothetical protein
VLKRIAVFLAAAMVVPVFASAQTGVLADQARIRITGPQAYEIPGLLKIARAAVSGDASLTIEEKVVRVVSPATGLTLVVLRPGKQLIGRVLEVKEQMVEVLPEGQRDTVRIPIDSIGRLEVSERRGRSHLLRGILVGAGTFYGVGWLMFSQCGLDCGGAVLLPAIAAGTAAGAVTGRDRERWKTVPADSLTP